MDVEPDPLAQLYEGGYSRLVAVVTAVCRERDVAEEAVQEAFVRLIGRWGSISNYEDPEAWVRMVALRLAMNRQRKVRNGLRAITRLGGNPGEQPEPTGDRVDLTRALGALPQDLRAVLVLHYFCDLPVNQIATELNIPAGTVKSRLSRGRAALLPTLQEEDTRA